MMKKEFRGKNSKTLWCKRTQKKDVEVRSRGNLRRRGWEPNNSRLGPKTGLE